VPLPGQTVLKA